MRFLLALSGLFVASVGSTLEGVGVTDEVGAVAPVVGADPEPLPDLSTPEAFGRFVQPILSDHCYTCHGPDSGTREADLRLDLRSALEASGAVVPGDVEGSELAYRVTTDDEWDVMPPPSMKNPLTELEQRTLLGWIEAGAPWAEHWAFVKPERGEVPETAASARNGIDGFVRARLEAEGIEPSERAEPHALLRRLMLELTGLPPTLEEIAEFEGELEGGADVDLLLDRWIDRIFGEEPYATRSAEHRSRAWLDAARYADTIGIHTDNSWQAWAWRDWVVGALRDNQPFDQFVVDQLAGDLVPEPTTEQLVATGFHRLHVVTDEGGAINEEYLVEYAVDRVSTTGSVLLGLTLGCARCHDHKYDPVSQEDFYGLIDFFDGVEQPGLYSQNPGETERAFEPFIALDSPELDAALADNDARQAAIEEELAEVSPEEQRQLAAFEDEANSFVQWRPSLLLDARAAEGSTIERRDDGSVQLVGERNHGETVELELSVTGSVNAFLFEALPEDGAEGTGRIGRADNGNAVVRELRLERVRDGRREPVELSWIAASHEQPNSDFNALNALDAGPHVWAFNAHMEAGRRWALVLLEDSVTLAAGESLVLTIDSRSPYAHHVPGRPRASFGWVSGNTRAMLPTVRGRMLRSNSFEFNATEEGYGGVFPPEEVTRLERGVEYPLGDEGGSWSWSFDQTLVDDEPFALGTSGRDVILLARELVAPTPRSVPLSLGSDDGFVLRLDGEVVAENRVDRGVAADQDRVELQLSGERQLLIQRVVNTGGAAGAYQRFERAEGVLPTSLLPFLFPARSQDVLLADARAAWRRDRSPRYAELEGELDVLRAERQATLDARPRAMVMRERDMQDATYVLLRGDYRTPDTSRPVEPSLPAVLGNLPEDAPRDRLGLARWMVSDDNPLTARVIVNRMWAGVFGTGLVATTDDFGLQGERPTHPELLDWLATEFVASGWDQQHLLRLMLESATWRQSSDWRPEVAEVDPDDRLLARYPRKRVPAETIRDAALYAAGLLNEQPGGPPVRPYQPEGLWQEVAMLQSNTRFFERDEGTDLWRRSLYTFWKRASPPPSMLAFDAPTREFCVVERGRTDTPLQALVLLNDEQFIEAARELAERCLAETPGDAEATLEAVFRRVLTRAPSDDERAALLTARDDLAARYAAEPEAAEALLSVGEAGRDGRIDAAELAAWTLVASAVLNLYETTDPR